MSSNANIAKIEIVFENKDFIAVDKPPGISVHNQEDATNLLQEVSNQLNISQVWPVHRLDKDTSGVQILALNKQTATRLAQEFQNHKVEKVYDGVIAGKILHPGTWDQALSDKAEGTNNPQGKSADRVPAITHFKPLKSDLYFTHCEFLIETGRQHQIRKHCLLNGHALVGDNRYGNPKYNQKIAQIYGFQRLALHCRRIVLIGLVIEIALPNEFKILSLFK